jgi:hypothetical protein
MGRKAQEIRQKTQRRIRSTPLTDEELALLAKAAYEGSPLHKKNPGNFRLTPPAAPRPDKTLCDEAGVNTMELASELFQRAVARGLVSDATTSSGFPKQIWVVDEKDRVFEAMYGGSRDGRYHGYPIRRSDPLFQKVRDAWQS